MVKALKFKIGDMVDGMCTLSNGSTRWFPGVIEEVWEEEDDESEKKFDRIFYTVRYNDGDLHRKKPSGEIRISRKLTRKKKLQRNSPKQQQPTSILSCTSLHTSSTCLKSIELNFKLTQFS